MRGAFLQAFSDRPGVLLRRRTTALGLVVAAHALLVLMLLRLAPPVPPSVSPAITAIELIPEPVTRAEPVVKPRRETRRAEPQPIAPPVPPPEVPSDLGMIRLTPEEYAASNIDRLPRRPGPATGEAAEAEAAEAAAARAPNGERLYNAEWYREPTQAELAYYLPGGRAPLGWAMIACQTVDDYRVDNCVELGQSPAGSGLASAIREAAWQFRVWPPRIGGRVLVGAWVRIKIDFTELPTR